MFETVEQQARITRLAWFTTLATLVIGQLHALARFRTADGSSDLDLPLTGWWAEPAGRALDPLLDWASPDTVYLTYGKWWVVALGMIVVAGAMVMRLRAPYGVELWGWRIFLLGYALLAASAGIYYWGQWTSYNALEDAVGLWMYLPGALLGTIGSMVLGVGLLRRRVRPWLPAVLLVLTIPELMLISEVTSLGNADLPIMFAIAMLAGAETRRTASGERRGATSEVVPTPTPTP